MGQRRVMVVVAVVLCSGFVSAASAAAGPSAPAAPGAVLSGTWGTAQEVPGTSTLNVDGRAGINSVSCVSAGNCGAGGFYSSGNVSGKPNAQAMVVSESGGTWGTAQEVPGTSTLNAGKMGQVISISCAAAGDCSAGGFYTDASGDVQAFVVTETAGTWGTAVEVPGTAALDQHSPGAEVRSVSCGAAGNCSAGGFYTNASGKQEAFIDTETGGTWGTAVEVPGTAALNAGGDAQISSVSCSAARDCSAGGFYASSVLDHVPTVQAMVVTETRGTWGTAQEVPGTATLNAGGYAEITSVSCTAAGYCSAGGDYANSTPASEAFVVRQTGGTWATAHEVRRIATLNTSGLAFINSVSCTSAGNCMAVGSYEDANFDSQAFYVGESGGTWGSAEEVRGSASLDQGSPGAAAVSVSCGAAGDCGMGGYYTTSSGNQQAFVASESGGTWAAAQEVPGTATLNAGGAGGIASVSCASAGNCSAGGYYTDASGSQQAFVVDETGS